MKNIIQISGLFLLFACFTATSATAQSEDSDDDIFVVVEKNPYFPGGQDSMFAFIGNNVNYPKDAVKQKIEGRVIVSFVVEKDGSLSNFIVKKGVHKSLDAEALRVMKSMPDWTPGTQMDVPVRVEVTIPIMFKL